MYESKRSKPKRWVPFAWMPNYDEAKAKRPGTGYESHRSRRARLELQCLAYVFDRWDERTAERIQVVWAGKIQRPTKVYLGAVVVDHPQLDKFTGGSCIVFYFCIHCSKMK
jgi:hypothetical protein